MQSFKQVRGLNQTIYSVRNGELTEINFTSTLRDYYNTLEAKAKNYNNLIMSSLSGSELTPEQKYFNITN